MPGALLADGGCAYPGDLPRRRRCGGGGRRHERARRRPIQPRARRRALHARAARAIDDRSGSALLAANAGSGKTAVMVERFVEAVLSDGVPVGVDPRAHVHREGGRRAARADPAPVHGARRGRARARGARPPGSGRSTASARGSCGRGRSPPASTRASPCSTSAAARRARRARVRRARSRRGRRRAAPRRSTSPPPTAPALRDVVLARPRDAAQPRSSAAAAADPAAAPRRPTAGALAAARDAAAAALAVVADGKKVAAAREALDALRVPPARASGVPWPGALDAAKLGTGAKALDDPACAAYREAWEAYRAACADHHGRAALVLLDDLLDRFNAAYDEAKAARAGVDFSDLELRVRDLLDDPAARAALGRAVRADHGRRVPGHEPPAARRARVARARQPVRGRRRVPVDLRLPPRRRDDLPRAAGAARRRRRAPAGAQLPLRRGAARRAQRRVRARSSATASRRSSPGAADTDGPLRLFDPDPRPASRRSSCC